MYLTRQDLNQCCRLAILEQAGQGGQKYKDYILKEMTYNQALNMVFNPLNDNFIKTEVLEKKVFGFIKEVEEARVNLLENNRRKKRLVSTQLNECLMEGPIAKGSEWATKGVLGLGKMAGKASKKLGKGAVKGTQAIGSVPYKMTQGVAKGLGRGDISSAMDTGASYKDGTAAQKTAAMLGKHKGKVTGALGTAALGYGAYKWAQRRKKAKEKAAMDAAETSEALSEMALSQGNWDMYLISLEETRKWVERSKQR